MRKASGQAQICLEIVLTRLADKPEEKQPRKRDESRMTPRNTAQLAREGFVCETGIPPVESEDPGKRH